jgi:hypothetical protein
MIDFQSSVIAKRPNDRPCHSPSPGGQGRGEGELSHRGRQSALIKVGAKKPCHQIQHLLGVHSVYSVKNSVSLCLCRKNRKNCQTNPFSLLRSWWFNRSIQGFPKPLKAIQRYPRLLKGFWKKIIFCSTTRPISTYSGLFRPIGHPLPPGLYNHLKLFKRF